MLTILLIIQIFIALALVAVVLLQQPSSDGIGSMGGGASTGGGMMSSRGSANLLTKATSILAFLFMLNCLGMAMMISRSDSDKSIADEIIKQQESLPETLPGDNTNQKPAQPMDVPLAE